MPWRETFCGSQYEQMEIRDLIIKHMLKNDIKFYTKTEKIEHGSKLLLSQEQLLPAWGEESDPVDTANLILCTNTEVLGAHSIDN